MVSVDRAAAQHTGFAEPAGVVERGARPRLIRRAHRSGGATSGARREGGPFHTNVMPDVRAATRARAHAPPLATNPPARNPVVFPSGVPAWRASPPTARRIPHRALREGGHRTRSTGSAAASANSSTASPPAAFFFGKNGPTTTLNLADGKVATAVTTAATCGCIDTKLFSAVSSPGAHRRLLATARGQAGCAARAHASVLWPDAAQHVDQAGGGERNGYSTRQTLAHADMLFTTVSDPATGARTNRTTSPPAVDGARVAR